MRNSRRDFVKAAAGLSVANTLWAAEAAGGIPRRPLGKTGLQVSIMGLGGARIGMLLDNQPAVDVVRRCYDLGVNYFDAAAAGAYGLSQVRYGIVLKDVRDKVVLATKTRHRTFTQAQLDLDQSLSNLRTDRIDLYQVHNVINDEDIEFIFAPKGVMEMIEKAKKAGKIRFVGVTGHTDPAVLNRILARYKFDTILMPLSVTDGGNSQKSFEQATLPVARQKGMGIIAMKTLGAGQILRQKAATMEDCLRYVWSLPVSTAILGCQEVAQVEANLRVARVAKPLSATAMNRLRRNLATLEPWKRPSLEPDDERRYVAD
ncbi:MAG: aldo/keto reductase [Acidobacteria bacterium]|nr:aldo/keto reductase [Acidobacteriota bacterium]